MIVLLALSVTLSLAALLIVIESTRRLQEKGTSVFLPQIREFNVMIAEQRKALRLMDQRLRAMEDMAGNTLPLALQKEREEMPKLENDINKLQHSLSHRDDFKPSVVLNG